MPDDPAAELLRLWLGAQGAQGARDAGAAQGLSWQRAEALFRTWNDLTGAFGAGGAEARSLFDPTAWLRPEGEGSLALLRGWMGAGDGAAAQEWAAYMKALEHQQEILGAAWLAAFRAFAEEARRAFDDAARHRKPAPGWRELEAMWRRVADSEFAATQSSAPFLEGQEALLAAALDLRIRLRGEVEAVAGLLGLPTRAEVDDMAEAIHQLRREVRALKRRGEGG